MKKLTLLAAAALSCCSLSPTFAQVQVVRSGARPSASRLVSNQTELNGLQPFAAAGQSSQQSVAQEAVPNPFDYFSEDLPTVQPKATSSDISPDRLTEEQSLLEGDLPTSSFAPQADDSKPSSVAQEESNTDDADSTPVGRHHRHNPSVVDTIVTQAALGNVPHCATTPIYWGETQHTPNPVAEWLLREQCVAGLWAGYPQQRAAECAHMWACLSGHSCSCGSGCGSGCGQVSGSCSGCAHPHGRHNRYTGRFSAAPMGCQSCNTCQTDAAPCDANSSGDTLEPAAPDNPDDTHSTADDTHSTAGLTPSQPVKTSINNLAQLPSLQTYR